MHVEQLPEEIWKVILGHLRKPIPAPLSRPHRSALRQHDLAMASRVCKLFHSICIPLLYRNIATDNFPDLLLATGKSTHGLLTRTESLYIEYSEIAVEPDYHSLLYVGKHLWTEQVGRGRGSKIEDLIMEHCQFECMDLFMCCTELVRMRMTTILPQLRTVAVSSIYGREGDVWSRYDDMCVDRGDESELGMTVDMWEAALATSNVEEICIRDPGGPLAISPLSSSHPDDPVPAFRPTLHFNGNTDIMFFALGRPTRWALDPDYTGSWAKIFHTVGENMSKLAMARGVKSVSKRKPPIDLDIFCSTDRIGDPPSESYIDIELLDTSDNNDTPTSLLSVGKQRKMSRKLSSHCQSLLRRYSGAKDLIRWNASPDTPICAACGTGPPMQ